MPMKYLLQSTILRNALMRTNWKAQKGVSVNTIGSSDEVAWQLMRSREAQTMLFLGDIKLVWRNGLT